MNDPDKGDLLPAHAETDAYLKATYRNLTESLAAELDLGDGLTAILHGDSPASERHQAPEHAGQPMAVMLISIRILAHALADDPARAPARDIIRTRDLARDLDRALASIGALDSDLALVRIGANILVGALDLDLGRAPARDIIRARARALSRDLARISVDASGIDLSGLDVGNLDALRGVTWTSQTTWPPSIADQIRANSVPISEGLWQVRPGGIAQDSTTVWV